MGSSPNRNERASASCRSKRAEVASRAAALHRRAACARMPAVSAARSAAKAFTASGGAPAKICATPAGCIVYGDRGPEQRGVGPLRDGLGQRLVRRVQRRRRRAGGRARARSARCRNRCRRRSAAPACAGSRRSAPRGRASAASAGIDHRAPRQPLVAEDQPHLFGERRAVVVVQDRVRSSMLRVQCGSARSMSVDSRRAGRQRAERIGRRPRRDAQNAANTRRASSGAAAATPAPRARCRAPATRVGFVGGRRRCDRATQPRQRVEGRRAAPCAGASSCISASATPRPCAARASGRAP